MDYTSVTIRIPKETDDEMNSLIPKYAAHPSEFIRIAIRNEIMRIKSNATA